MVNDKMVHILILNGPNLNRLGMRKPEIYGSKTMAQILLEIQRTLPEVRLTYFQSNHEGDLIDQIQAFEGDGIVLNGLAVIPLAQGLGLDGLAFGGDADHVPGKLGDFGLLSLGHQLEDIAHVLRVDILPLGGKGQQAVDGLLRQHHVLGLRRANQEVRVRLAVRFLFRFFRRVIYFRQKLLFLCLLQFRQIVPVQVPVNLEL